MTFPPREHQGFHVGLKAFIERGGKITLSREHKDFRWVSKEEVGTLKFENTYKEAVEYYFASYPDGLRNYRK